MADRLRVATVGAGYFSRFQYEAWSRMPDVELVAICNRTAAKARQIAQAHAIPQVYTEFDRMLAEDGSPDTLP